MQLCARTCWFVCRTYWYTTIASPNALIHTRCYVLDMFYFVCNALVHSTYVLTRVRSWLTVLLYFASSGFQRPANLHGQDAPVAVTWPEQEGRAQGLHAAHPRHESQRGRRLHLPARRNSKTNQLAFLSSCAYTVQHSSIKCALLNSMPFSNENYGQYDYNHGLIDVWKLFKAYVLFMQSVQGHI